MIINGIELKKEVYLTKEVAQIFSVKKRTVVDWIARGLMTASKPGGRLLFISRETIIDFYNNGEVDIPKVA